MVLALGALAGLVAFASCEEGKPEPTAEEKAKAAEEAARPTCVNIAKKQARLCCAPGQKSSMPKGYSPEEMAGTDFKQWCSDGDKPVSPYLVWTDQTKLQCAPDTKLSVADWKDDEDFGTEHVCMKGDVKEGQTMRYHPTGERYELATYMRNDPRLKAVPIIMITSRTGEKHRQRAFDIGVDRYLGKPYQEADLLQNVEEILRLNRALH